MFWFNLLIRCSFLILILSRNSLSLKQVNNTVEMNNSFSTDETIATKFTSNSTEKTTVNTREQEHNKEQEELRHLPISYSLLDDTKSSEDTSIEEKSHETEFITQNIKSLPNQYENILGTAGGDSVLYNSSAAEFSVAVSTSPTSMRYDSTVRNSQENNIETTKDFTTNNISENFTINVGEDSTTTEVNLLVTENNINHINAKNKNTEEQTRWYNRNEEPFDLSSPKPLISQNDTEESSTASETKNRTSSTTLRTENNKGPNLSEISTTTMETTENVSQYGNERNDTIDSKISNKIKTTIQSPSDNKEAQKRTTANIQTTLPATTVDEYTEKIDEFDTSDPSQDFIESDINETSFTAITTITAFTESNFTLESDSTKSTDSVETETADIGSITTSTEKAKKVYKPRQIILQEVRNHTVPVDIRNHPYMVSVQKEMIHFCCGTIVSSYWVLTAARCLSEPGSTLHLTEITMIAVVAGQSQLGLGKMQIRKPKNFFLHNRFVKKMLLYDIGMINLYKPFDLTEFVNVVQLSSSISKPYKIFSSCYVVSWTVYRKDFLSFDKLRAEDVKTKKLFKVPELQMVNLPTLTDEECSERVGAKDFITRYHLCTEFGTFKNVSCGTDVGSPLICDGRQYGIFSWGVGCEDYDYPGVFTRVSALRMWINDIQTDPKDYISRNKVTTVFQPLCSIYTLITIFTLIN